MKKIQLTKEGFDNLQKEYQTLKEVKRPAVVERLQKARAMGDLSENSAYSSAKEELSFVEGRIQEIEEILKNAEVSQHNKSANEISLGAWVTVEIDGKKQQFHIVGEFEADPIKKKLSHTSPTGKALMGKKTGELVEVIVPAGKLKYKVIKID